jgi:hypothetical protein
MNYCECCLENNEIRRKGIYREIYDMFMCIGNKSLENQMAELEAKVTELELIAAAKLLKELE